MHWDRLQITLFNLFSGWGWALLLATVWMILACLATFRLRFRSGIMRGLLVATALQALAAGSAAVVTSLDSIDAYACLMGMLGFVATAFVIVVEAGLLIYLSKQWPRNAAGKRDLIVGWVLIWSIFSMVVLIVHVRSAALCTV
ncbi:MAG: hypothetical protein HOP03_05355 [Lysobacter sp.]|nr:hypothetical protein [Lysobacter sp.]